MELAEALDTYIPDPVRALDKPFMMPVEDVFSITGRGTVATGRIEQGIVHTGDQVEIVGIRPASSTTVVTGLGNAASYSAYGSAAAQISFLSYYFPQATDNPVNAAMITAIQKAGSSADLFSPDGFVAAQMIVHAVEGAGGDNVDKMIKALEGWTFDAPKGSETIRVGDHAMLQPMFQAKLVQQGTSWEPQLGKVIPPGTTAPAET